jgi:integrase/recombinase XerC
MNIRTMNEVFLKHLEKKGKSFNTIKNYKNDLNCFLEFMTKKQGHSELKDFTTSAVLEYSAYLDNKYAADNSKRRRVQTLRLLFDYLVERKHWGHNPVRKIPVSPKKLDLPKPADFLSIQKLLSHLKKQSDSGSSLEKLNANRNLLILHLIYSTGLKVSDIAKLKKPHLLHGQNGHRVMVLSEKRDPYTIPMPDSVSNLIANYFDQLIHLERTHKIVFDDLLYNANAHRVLGGGLSPRGIEILFERLGNEIDIKITPKALRQSCILKWIHEDVADPTIKEWMGVKPNYSLKMYKKFYENNKNDCSFGELHFN